MDALIAPQLTWHEGDLREGLAIRLRGGVISEIRPLGRDTPDLRPHLALPGATDLQVNGGGGVLFNATPTPEGIAAIRAAGMAVATSTAGRAARTGALTDTANRRRMDTGTLRAIAVSTATGAEAARLMTRSALGLRKSSPYWHEFTAATFE